jgi:hypothetical protein
MSNSDKWDTVDDLPDELKTPDQRETTAATPEGFDPVEGPTDTETGGSTDDGQESEHIPTSGHEEFLERQRLEDIIVAQRDARQAVAQAGLREAEIGTKDAGYLVDKTVAGQVTRLISMVEQPLRETTAGQEYWEYTHLDTFTAEPPQEVLNVVAAEAEGVPNRCLRSTDSGVEITLSGLRDFYALPQEISLEATCENELKRRGSPVEEQTVEWKTTVPRRISEVALRQVSTFLSEMGLDLQHEQNDDYELDFGGD